MLMSGPERSGEKGLTVEDGTDSLHHTVCCLIEFFVCSQDWDVLADNAIDELISKRLEAGPSL